MLQVAENGSPSAQHSLLLAPEHAVSVAIYLRDTLGYDYCSNVTGLDWQTHLEAVYHLYSMENKTTEPLVLRMHTGDRAANVHLPSLTPVWRSCEFQEREIFDLFGIIFDGHPDLRRILMWDDFADHPMRRDYVEPDDFEYEPTAHDEVLARTRQHFAALTADHLDSTGGVLP